MSMHSWKKIDGGCRCCNCGLISVRDGNWLHFRREGISSATVRGVSLADGTAELAGLACVGTDSKPGLFRVAYRWLKKLVSSTYGIEW